MNYRDNVENNDWRLIWKQLFSARNLWAVFLLARSAYGFRRNKVGFGRIDMEEMMLLSDLVQSLCYRSQNKWQFLSKLICKHMEYVAQQT